MFAFKQIEFENYSLIHITEVSMLLRDLLFILRKLSCRCGLKACNADNLAYLGKYLQWSCSRFKVINVKF